MKSYKNELEKYISQRESENADYFSRCSYANFNELNHNMLIGEELEKIYNDLSDLEKTDLIDFFNLENNARTNKKR